MKLIMIVITYGGMGVYGTLLIDFSNKTSPLGVFETLCMHHREHGYAAVV